MSKNVLPVDLDNFYKESGRRTSGYYRKKRLEGAGGWVLLIPLIMFLGLIFGW